MERATTDTPPLASRRRLAIVFAYVLSAILGYTLGRERLLPFPERSTALARVGLALSARDLSESPQAWALLRSDVDLVRERFEDDQRQGFDLVVAVRGLESGGNPEWTRAEAICRALDWQRCDRSSLEELARRARP